MKHINDDAKYAAQVEILNELSRKKDSIDAEINKIWAVPVDVHHAEISKDAILTGQAIEPGVATVDEGHARRTRLSVLQTQSDQLRKAIHAQHLQVEIVQRTAAYRVYAASAAPYLQLGDQLVSQVEAIVATSEALKKERRAFYGRGVAEPPLIEFPEYGFSEQLPAWLKALRETVRRARLTQQTYATEKNAQE